MRIELKHVQKRGLSEWRYRRKVPERLRPIIGKHELVFPLGSSESAAAKNYAKTHAAAERLLTDAEKLLKSQGKAPQSGSGGPSPLELYLHSQQQIGAWRLERDWRPGDEHGEDDHEALARDVIAEGLVKEYPVDKETGHPIGVSAKDAALLAALAYGADQKRPEPTLEDARKLYLKERIGDDEKKRLQLERVFGYLKAALGADRRLTSLRREDAKEVRDYMLDGRAASSVDRYLNTVRAVINHAIKEWDLAGLRNPFMGLEVVNKDKAEPDRSKKRGFTDDELKAVRARIMGNANEELQLIWRMLEGTGCRLAEIAGLRTRDVRLDHAIPHIAIEWHDERRVKNKSSQRNIPLVGDALEAAKRAAEAAGAAVKLFPLYGRKGGADAASAALGKHVRACVTDEKVTTHSLRHRMKDKLRLASVGKADQDIVLGHSSGNVGEDYGSDEARLRVAERALRAALQSNP